MCTYGLSILMNDNVLTRSDFVLQEYIDWLLQLSASCLHHLNHAPLEVVSLARVQEVLDFYAETFCPLWRAVWDIETPFLDWGTALNGPTNSPAPTIHDALANCIDEMSRVVEKHQ